MTETDAKQEAAVVGLVRAVLDSLLQLPGVHDLRSNIAIRTVKHPAPLPLQHLQHS